MAALVAVSRAGPKWVKGRSSRAGTETTCGWLCLPAPGPRAWDLAHLAYRRVPLTDPANHDGLANSPAERARRLQLLCDAYNPGARPADLPDMALRRLTDLAAFTQARTDAGQEHLRSHVTLYHRDADWIRTWSP